MSETPDEIIARWQALYSQVNGEKAPSMAYQRGWFVLHDPFPSRHRRLQVQDWIDRLQHRLPAPEVSNDPA